MRHVRIDLDADDIRAILEWEELADGERGSGHRRELIRRLRTALVEVTATPVDDRCHALDVDDFIGAAIQCERSRGHDGMHRATWPSGAATSWGFPSAEQVDAERGERDE